MIKNDIFGDDLKFCYVNLCYLLSLVRNKVDEKVHEILSEALCCLAMNCQDLIITRTKM